MARSSIIRPNIEAPAGPGSSSADPPQISFSYSCASPILWVPVSDRGRGFPVTRRSGVTRLRPGAESAAQLDRLAQPLHDEFEVLRLQMAPVLELGLVPLVREALVIFPNCLPGGRALLCELLADERVSGHGCIKAPRAAIGKSFRGSDRVVCEVVCDNVAARWRPLGTSRARQRR
jgi:hypothetical protein